MCIDMCTDMYRHAKVMHMNIDIDMYGHGPVHRHVHVCVQTSLVDMHMCAGIDRLVCMYMHKCVYGHI